MPSSNDRAGEVVGELAEWDWCRTIHGDRLHHVASFDQPLDWENDCGGAGVASCGVRSDWFMIPGIFSRMGMERCSRCCTVMGFPQGTGSPKNDKACRPLVEARIG